MADAAFSSAAYWERRYAKGGTSGAGSLGELAAYKASVVNGFLKDRAIRSVADLGCGDGTQAAMIAAPDYLGLDVSPTALALCARRLEGRAGVRLASVEQARAAGWRAEIGLSLDIVYHLVEDATFDAYMHDLVGLSRDWMIVYASDHDAPGPAPHVRHRAVSAWMASRAPLWRRIGVLDNPFDYARAPDPDRGTFAFFQLWERGGRSPPRLRRAVTRALRRREPWAP